MKVLSRSETRLVLGVRGIDVFHWGYLAVFLSIFGLTAMFSQDKPVPVPAVAVCAFFLAFGLFAAVFMRKQLTHLLDKTAGTLVIEYPAGMNTTLEIVTVPLTDIEGVCTSKQNFMSKMASGGSIGRNIPTGMGFFYLRKGGEKVESGLYSSVHEEIEAAVEAIKDFLELQGEKR